jgi:hypothetical protein
MVFKAKVQIVPQSFSVVEMSWQRQVFFGQSNVIPVSDFSGDWFHG